MKKSQNIIDTEKAFDHPQVGDHFFEMGSYHVFVVYCQDDVVVTCSANAPCTFPEDGHWDIYTSLESFRKHFAYGIKTAFCKYSIRLANRGADIADWLELAPDNILEMLSAPQEYENFISCENIPFGWLP